MYNIVYTKVSYVYVYSCSAFLNGILSTLVYETITDTMVVIQDTSQISPFIPHDLPYHEPFSYNTQPINHNGVKLVSMQNASQLA